MASVQCYRTCQESCQQESHHGSLGQKVSDMFKGHHNHHNAATQSQTHCYGQSQMLPHSHSGHHNQYSAGTQTHTQGYGQNQMLPQSHSGHAATTKMTQTEYHYSQTQKTTQGIATGIGGSSRKCHGRSRREHKQGSMFQKIKDGLSGHSSDSCGSSDSESDSDNENCHRRRVSITFMIIYCNIGLLISHA